MRRDCTTSRFGRSNRGGWQLLTGKPDPGDVDLAVLTPVTYQLAGEQRFAAEGVDIQLLDIQFAHSLVDFQGWLAFFSTVRDGTSKGVVTLTF